MITRQLIANHILDYLNHRLTLAQLVEWAEGSMIDKDIEPEHSQLIMHVLGRIGVADVKEFGLLWEDCESMMNSLGFNIRVEANLAA